MTNTAEQSAAQTAVSKTLTVACKLDKAFAVFTDRMGAWWPATHHVGSAPFRDIVIEHRSGGRWYEINSRDEDCQWGTVLAWEPPHRLVISWHLGPDWKYDAALERASEIEVNFIPENNAVTRIEFTHRCLDRHGVNYGKLRSDIDSPGGWTAILAAYQKLAETGAE